MSIWSIRRLWGVLGVLSPALALAACSGPNANEAYTGPGWYLEKPYMMVVAGPKVFGGPFSYSRCEEERTKLGPEVATGMLCVNHPGKPTKPGNL